jgi:hypothetical protein
VGNWHRVSGPRFPSQEWRKNLPEKRRKPAENALIRHRRERFRWNWDAAGRAQLLALHGFRRRAPRQTPSWVQPPRARPRVHARSHSGPRRFPCPGHGLRGDRPASWRPRPAAPSHASMRSPPRATRLRDRGLFPPIRWWAPSRGTEGGSSSGSRDDAPKTRACGWVGPLLFGGRFQKAANRSANPRATRNLPKTPPKWARKSSRKGAAGRYVSRRE